MYNRTYTGAILPLYLSESAFVGQGGHYELASSGPFVVEQGNVTA